MSEYRLPAKSNEARFFCFFRSRFQQFAFLLAVGIASPAFANDDVRRLTDDARRDATRLLEQIRSEVARELESGGPLRAIVVCKHTATELTASMSRLSGMRITRISLRPRNPVLGEPDAWEQSILLDFEKRITKGEKSPTLEHAAIVTEPAGRYFRYVKAIPMTGTCTGCHGNALPEAVRAMLATEYPHDRAIDYAIGQLRGAISIKKPL